MLRVKNIILCSMVFFIVSCVNNGVDNPLVNINYSDPDPLSEDELLTAPEAPSSLFVLVNIDGEIRSFFSNAPNDYTVIVNDASTDDYFGKFKLSDDRKYLLYVNTYNNLILNNISDPADSILLQENVSCNEMQFFTKDGISKLQYSHDGEIICYNISNGSSYPMVEDSELFCNHGAVVSPSGNKIVFKDQNPEQTEYAVFAWAEVADTTVTTSTLLGNTEDIELLELPEFTWINSDTIFYKPLAGVNTRLKAYKINELEALMDAPLFSGGSVISFSNIVIDGNLSRICIYGSLGLYQIEMSSIDFSNNQIDIDVIYVSEIVKTKFADYSKDSKYLVSATDACINIYEAETMKQTNFDYAQVINDGETLLYLCCN